jgi:hypothetical protein
MPSTKSPNLDLVSVIFGGRVFQQTVGIPIGANCALLLADLFLYSYEVDFIQGLLKTNEAKLVRTFDLMIQVQLEFCYIEMESSQWEN